MKRAVLSAFALIFCAAGLLAQSAGDTGPSSGGLVVASVLPDSPAAKAGIVKGDTLLALDGTKVGSFDELVRILATHNAGDTLQATILHSGERKELAITLGTRLYHPVLGLSFEPPAGGPVRAQGGRPGGALVRIVEPESPASAAGLKQGDLILSVDGTPLGPKASLASLIGAHKPGEVVTLSVLTAPLQPKKSPMKILVTLGDVKGEPYLGVQYSILPQHPYQPGGQGYDRFYPFAPPLGSGSLPSGPGSGLSVPQGGLSF